jgi:ParB/RepB/Spo0J family partition protein
MPAKSKLTPKQIIEIREAPADVTNAALAKRYEVDQSSISRARRGKTWGSDKAAAVPESPAEVPAGAKAGGLMSLPLHKLLPSPWNPRSAFDKAAIAELADSIAAHGLLENLVVAPGSFGGYLIVAGERRYRALKRLEAEGRWDPKAAAIPCRIVTGPEGELRALALVENLHRADLSPLDEAAAFQALMGLDNNRWTTKAIAEAIGKTPRHVQLRLELGAKLGPGPKKALAEGRITLAFARAMTNAPANDQDELVKSVEKGWLRTAADVRKNVYKGMVPVTRAIFPVDKYKGEIVDDLETGTRYFADCDAFMKLQKAAATAKVKALEKEWAWVTLTDYFYGPDYETSDDKATAGAIVVFDNYTGGTVKIHTGLVKRGAAQQQDSAETAAERKAWEEARRVACDDFNAEIQRRLTADPMKAIQWFILAALVDNFVVPDAKPWRPTFGDLVDPEAEGLALREDADLARAWKCIASLPEPGQLSLAAALIADDVGLSPYHSKPDDLIAAVAEALAIPLPEHLRPEPPKDDLDEILDGQAPADKEASPAPAADAGTSAEASAKADDPCGIRDMPESLKRAAK